MKGEDRSCDQGNKERKQFKDVTENKINTELKLKIQQKRRNGRYETRIKKINQVNLIFIS